MRSRCRMISACAALSASSALSARSRQVASCPASWPVRSRALRARVSAVASARSAWAVRSFADLMAQRRGRDLEKWITTASSQPLLRSFADGLRRDQDAVTAGLTLPWSSGVVEGHVNLKVTWNLPG